MEAKNLKSIIDRKGLKQVWIAEKLGVTKSLVSQWVKGTTAIPAKHQSELTRILK